MTDKFLTFAAPGHFYSPIPDLKEIAKNSQFLFDKSNPAVLGIDLRLEHQLQVLQEITGGAADFRRMLSSKPTRYTPDNYFFREADAFTLFSMIRRHRPKRIIEVGSGYTSALTLDSVDHLRFTLERFMLIEPHAERLDSLLFKTDLERCEIHRKRVQEVDVNLFSTLESRDLLIIDSSHVGKIGSDVLHLLFEVIPRLAPGVLIHVHDLFWRFEYPNAWLEEGRCWNESYFIRAFLAFNAEFQIELWPSYLQSVDPGKLDPIGIPEMSQHGGGSLWIRRKHSPENA